MGKSRLGQVWAARQFARNRPWQRAREIRKQREIPERVAESQEEPTGIKDSGNSENREESV